MTLKRENYPVKKVILALASLVVLIAAQTAAAELGSLALLCTHLPALGNGVAGALYPAFALVGLWALCRFGMKEPLSAYRLGPVRLKAVWCAAAALMPALVCGVFLLLPGEWAEAAERTDTASILAVGVLYLGIGTGIVEEAVFRGFIMTALERRWGRSAAVLLPSILFGALHIMGNELDVLSMVQLVAAGTMVGVLFSLVALETGSVWNGALIHGVWNCVLMSILYIGPEANPGALFSYIPVSDNFLLTGGAFGIEASAVSIAAYAMFAGLALWLLRKQAPGRESQ